MKQLFASLIVASLVIGSFGCGRQEEPQPPAQPADTPAQDASQAAGAVKETVEQAAEAAKETATQAAEQVKEQAEAAQTAAKEAAAKVQTIIDSAKKLVGEGKWQEASKSLEGLAGLKPTAEQQSVIDQLKQQIKQLQDSAGKVTEDAAKAAGNLLNK